MEQNRRRVDAPIPQRWGRIPPDYRIRPEDRGPQAIDAVQYNEVMQRLQAQTNELQNLANNRIWNVMRQQNALFQDLAPRIEFVLTRLSEVRNRELELTADEYRTELARLRQVLQNVPNFEQLQDAVRRQEQYLTGFNEFINNINLPEGQVEAIYNLLFPPEGEENGEEDVVVINPNPEGGDEAGGAMRQPYRLRPRRPRQ